MSEGNKRLRRGHEERVQRITNKEMERKTWSQSPPNSISNPQSHPFLLSAAEETRGQRLQGPELCGGWTHCSSVLNLPSSGLGAQDMKSTPSPSPNPTPGTPLVFLSRAGSVSKLRAWDLGEGLH